MTSNSVIHQDQWYQPKQLSAVFQQLRRWLRLKSIVLKARLFNDDVCLDKDPDRYFHLLFFSLPVTVCDRYLTKYSILDSLNLTLGLLCCFPERKTYVQKKPQCHENEMVKAKYGIIGMFVSWEMTIC